MAENPLVATKVLRLIAILSAIEDQLHGPSAELRRALWAKQARTIVDDLHIDLAARLRRASAKNALCYALPCWAELS